MTRMVADVSVKDWVYSRPATTIAGRVLVADPGANANRFNGSTKSRNDGVPVTIAELARLQDFPDGYRFCGNKTDQAKQIGNAVPPTMARLLASLNQPIGEAVNDLDEPEACCLALVKRYGVEDARLFAALLVDALDQIEEGVA